MLEGAGVGDSGGGVREDGGGLGTRGRVELYTGNVDSWGLDRMGYDSFFFFWIFSMPVTSYLAKVIMFFLIIFASIFFFHHNKYTLEIKPETICCDNLDNRAIASY